MTTTKVLYSLSSAAEAVDLSVDTLRREYKAGRLSVKDVGGRYFVTHGELVRWADQLDTAAPGRAS